ncbi:hypothetical protein H2203_004673 [Taxawa tesnikishii (nom. ined.)]|nr:hypothetical protein H2203_004673 [Dothideales sp. JES 119]
MTETFDVATYRKHFPALGKEQVYFDNAGGSQVLKEVIDSVSEYLSNNNVQLGASYPVAQRSTQLFAAGSEAVAKYVNCDPSEIVIGPSTTQLFRNLSTALFDHVTPGSEIILSKLDHEANVASWLQLASWRQCTVKWWSSSSRTNPKLEVEELKKLLSEKTKLVACTHTSNILGGITDVKGIAKAVHEVPGALFVVDAVAFAPHRQVDVKEFGVDFYSFSWYKVRLRHYFKSGATLEEKLGLAASNYELTASIPQVCSYLASIPWTSIAAYEQKLQGIIIDYLLSRPDIQIYGEPVADSTKRVPVISFTVKGRSSRSVVEAVEAKSNFGFRWGSFYSNRLVEEVLGLDPQDGVVRVSLVHYNTVDEVNGFVKVLDEVLNS